LIDAAEVAYADDGGLDLDLAESATLQMDTAPSNAALPIGSPADPTPTALTGLWQDNLVAFRVSRWVSYEVVRTGAVAYMTVSY
jgi:hypothetical protein